MVLCFLHLKPKDKFMSVRKNYVDLKIYGFMPLTSEPQDRLLSYIEKGDQQNIYVPENKQM